MYRVSAVDNINKISNVYFDDLDDAIKKAKTISQEILEDMIVIDELTNDGYWAMNSYFRRGAYHG